MGIPPRENQLLERPTENNVNEGPKNEYCCVFVVVLIQIPIAVMNLFMGFGDYGSCTDKRYDNEVRPWYRTIGIIECVLIGVFFLGFLL